jgi:acyl-CoA synthetase (AMP-forming)/AMP-acid ligase II
MKASIESNFAGRLMARLSRSSYLADAASGERVSVADLGRLVPGFGARLLCAGLNAGDRVLIGCALSPASAIAYWGAMYAGLVPVPVEESALKASGPALLNGTGAKAVWSGQAEGLDGLGGSGVLTLSGPPASIAADPIPPAVCHEDDLAALVATSGSTGAPRFVMVSHANLRANTEAIVRSQNLTADDKAMLVLPLSYCFGASVFHSHLYQGGSVIFDRRFMFADKVLAAVTQYECTSFAGVPTVYNILLRRSNIRRIALPSLKRFLQAGGPLAPPKILEMREAVPHARFYVMYGQTEATARISVLEPDRLHEKLGSVGRPLDNVTVDIEDEEGRKLPAGETGQIVVKGPSIARGYFNDPEETRRVFKDGSLHTGDVGCLDGDGYLWLSGRRNSFLKMRGVRVSFAEVEARVGAVPGVYECAASAAEHAEAGEALALLIVPEEEAGGVAERVRRSLPAGWTCASIKIVPELPKTANGKTRREKLTAIEVVETR